MSGPLSGLGPLPLVPTSTLPMLSFGSGFPEQFSQQQMGRLSLTAEVCTRHSVFTTGAYQLLTLCPLRVLAARVELGSTSV